MNLPFARKDGRTAVFISLIPKAAGGGSNSFAFNFLNWIKAHRESYRYTKDILEAQKAIIIADKGDCHTLRRAKEKGVFIIHRLDEYFVEGETGFRREKHQRIIELNRFADITVYQSDFVFSNVHPYLKAHNYTVIRNGADPEFFYPADREGKQIGHVSWSIGESKRFDLLYSFIESHPQEQFLLVGNHKKSAYDFRKFKNVTLCGAADRNRMRSYYQKMKMLYLPSENDPCPNTAIEAILCGVPVCFNARAGTKEVVGDCGLPLEDSDALLKGLPLFRSRCLSRQDLHFGNVARAYLSLKQNE